MISLRPVAILSVGLLSACLAAGCGALSPAAPAETDAKDKSTATGEAATPRKSGASSKPKSARPAVSTPTEETAPAGATNTSVVAKQPRYRASDPPPVHDDERLTRLGIRKYTSQRLRLYTDIAAELAEPLPALMDEAYAAWVQYFGPLPPDREGTEFVITGYLMADKALFREAGLLPEDLPPFPHGRNQGTRFWINEQPTDYYRRHLLLHEGTHCFMTTIRHPLRSQVWYMEGMAELFGTHRFDADGQPHFRVLPDSRERFANLGRIVMIEEEVAKQPPREMSAVMNLVPNDFLANPAYAWSWALCQFLDGHPRFHDSFQKLGQVVTTGERTDAWEKLFNTDRPDLEEAWLLFAANLCLGYDQARAAIDFQPGMPLPEDQSTQVSITADRGWQSTGVQVDAGRAYEITATGRVIIAHAPQASAKEAVAERSALERPWESEPQGISFRYHAGRPLGMLVAAIRAQPQPEEPPRTTLLNVLPIGRKAQITPAISGTLYLRLNDEWSELADNSGRVEVRVRGTTVQPNR